MTALMQLLYDYARNFLLPACVNREDIDAAIADEIHSLSALKKGLSAGQLAALKSYQRAGSRRKRLEQEALFRAALSLGRELR